MNNICINEIKKSLKQIKLKLLVPDIIFLIISFILLTIFTNYTGIAGLSEKELTLSISNNFKQFLISISTFLIIGFFIGARLKSFKLMMILNAVESKKNKILDSYKKSKKFYWRIIHLKILSFLIFLIAFIAAIVIYSLIETIFTKLALAIVILIFLILVLSLFFREAALFQKDIDPIQSIFNSFNTFKNNKFPVLTIVIIVFLINLGIAAMSNIVSYEWLLPAYMLIVLLISAWSYLFIFNTYKLLNKKTKVKKKTKRR